LDWDAANLNVGSDTLGAAEARPDLQARDLRRLDDALNHVKQQIGDAAKKVATHKALSAAQRAAVDHSLSTIETGASAEMKLIRRQAEEAADHRAASPPTAATWADRLGKARACYRELEADLARPSAGVPGWKDAFKADLAGLPRRLGPVIRWVETSMADRKTVTLRSGEHVHLMSNRATGSDPTQAVADVMIAHAKARGWSSVVFSGGTNHWRIEAARLATRRGLAVANPDLAQIVEDERILIRAEERLAQWRSAREAISREPDSTSLRGRFVSAIQSLADTERWREFATESEQDVLDYDFHMLRIREAAVAGSNYGVAEFDAFMTGTWREARQPARRPSHASP